MLVRQIYIYSYQTAIRQPDDIEDEEIQSYFG